MKKLRLIILAAAAAASSACSRSVERPVENVNAADPTPAASASRAPGMHVAETANVDLPPGDPVTRRQGGDTILERSNRQPRPDNPTTGPTPQLQFQAAPDDSRFAISMGADGVVREVRIFDRHPRLARVETAWDGSGPRDVAVSFRDGRTVRFQTERMQSLATMPAAEILKLAADR